MIDLVFWSFAVAVLPMVLALGFSMIAGAAGVLARPAVRPALRPDAWDRPRRLHFRPVSPPAFSQARLGSRYDDF